MFLRCIINTFVRILLKCGVNKSFFFLKVLTFIQKGWKLAKSYIKDISIICCNFQFIE